MDMNNEGGPSYEVPSQSELPDSSEQIQEQQLEQQRPAAQEAGVGERAPQPKSTAPTDVVVPDVPDVSVTVPTDKTPTKPVSPLTADLDADDSDLIGKQWVERVKVVQNQTHDDPHRQADEMSKVKVDFIQKRFNRSGKLNDAPST